MSLTSSSHPVTPRCHHVGMKLFISSLIGGYEAERAAVGHAASALRWELLRAEDFGARPETPQQACLQAVREADAVVLVLGHRYGAVQQGGLSATHEEWQEAKRTQKPVLVFVEDVPNRERAQDGFVNDVQDWAAGRLRESFRSPDELRDKVTRALADLAATGLADDQEMSERALAALPERRQNMLGSGPKLVVAIAAGPRQQVLRPAEIEDSRLIDDLQREAMFGPEATLSRSAATDRRLEGNRLRIVQDNAEVTVDEDGTVTITRPAFTTADRRETTMIPSVIEEDLRDAGAGALRFAFVVFERIDPMHRLTDAVPAAALYNAGHTPWRTRAEAAANQNSATMSSGRGEPGPVTRSPAAVRRAALARDAERIAEDLVVLLRRQHR